MDWFGFLKKKPTTLGDVEKGINEVKTKLAQLEADIVSIKSSPVQEPEKQPSAPSAQTEVVKQGGGARRSKKSRRTLKNRRRK